MRSGRVDLTTKAIIRDEALRLFAVHGPDAVTIRRIAAAAGVSPGLVIHHFGSKERLREAVDEHVARIFDDLFDRMAGGAFDQALSGGVGAGLVEAFLGELPPDSPIPGYLRRLLLSGDPAGTAVFRRWFRSSRAVVDALGAAGVLVPGGDIDVRTAFLMTGDLVLLLLRDQLADVLGVDPLAPAGMLRWADEVLEIYQGGLIRTSGAAEAAGAAGEERA